MATDTTAPIIDSITASPSVVAPNGSFVVSIVAHDPDSKSWTLAGNVTDSAGNAVTSSVVVTVSDPLTYSLVAPTGSGFTITPRAGQPGVFDCIAPA
jgi:hypothetical protein